MGVPGSCRTYPLGALPPGILEHWAGGNLCVVIIPGEESMDAQGTLKQGWGVRRELVTVSPSLCLGPVMGS